MKLPHSNEYIPGGLIPASIYKTKTMKILKIYSLEGKGLSEEECNRIKKFTETDVIIHITANNQLEGVQYPFFEFDEIYTAEYGLSCTVSRDDVKVIYDNTVRRFPEWNTSL